MVCFSRSLWYPLAYNVLGFPSVWSNLENEDTCSHKVKQIDLDLPMTWIGLHVLFFMVLNRYLRCNSLIRTIIFKWPWEYCSMTSRTSYGLRACCKKKTPEGLEQQVFLKRKSIIKWKRYNIVFVPDTLFCTFSITCYHMIFFTEFL